MFQVQPVREGQCKRGIDTIRGQPAHNYKRLRRRLAGSTYLELDIEAAHLAMIATLLLLDRRGV